jgi:uncharacterized protein (DUF58 family)
MPQNSPQDSRDKGQGLFGGAYLRKLEKLAILSRRAMAGQSKGERRSPKRGQSVEFADFRPYVRGDDIRRIDWNAYARLERFFIKLFVEEEDLTVHLLLDVSRSMDWGQPNKLRYALRTAGALGYIALVGLDRVTAAAFGLEFENGNGARRVYTPHRGKRQALGFFNYLQDLAGSPAYQGDSPFDPGRELGRYAASASQPGPSVLISDLMDEGWMQGIHSLAARGFEVSVIHLLSPEELDPQLSGDLKLLDSENQAEVEISADFDVLARYRETLQEWREELHRFCSQRRVHYIPVDTAIPMDELLFAWLRSGGLLK